VVADLNVLKFGLTVPLISRVRSCSGGEKAAAVAARNNSKVIISPSLSRHKKEKQSAFSQNVDEALHRLENVVFCENADAAVYLTT
jgi:hypothetical protein